MDVITLFVDLLFLWFTSFRVFSPAVLYRVYMKGFWFPFYGKFFFSFKPQGSFVLLPDLRNISIISSFNSLWLEFYLISYPSPLNLGNNTYFPLPFLCFYTFYIRGRRKCYVLLLIYLSFSRAICNRM